MCNRTRVEWAAVGETRPAGVEMEPWERQERPPVGDASKAGLGEEGVLGWLAKSGDMENLGSLNN